MDLSSREAADLARFFARRFPDRGDVDDLARQAGVTLDDTLAGDHLAVWSSFIVEAQAQGRLRRLARAAAGSDAADENLQEVCALLSRGEGPPTAMMVGLPAAVLAVLVLGIGAWWTLRSGPEPVAPPPVPAAAEQTTPTPPPLETVAPTPPPVTETPTLVTGRCGGQRGQVVGYWYAGRTPPGRAGQAITLRQGANVRADYPDVHNGYDARAPMVCSLVAGDRLTLSQDPIQVPGDAWWVPLVAGDLQP